MRVRNASMLVRGRATDTVPTDLIELSRVSHLLGYGLRGGQQPVVLQHIECRGPGLVGVHHHPCPGDAMNWRMDTSGRQLYSALAGQRLPRFIEDHQIAGKSFGPVSSKWQDQEPVFVPWQGDGEMVVYALLHLMQRGKPVGGGQVDPGLGDGILRNRCVDRVNGHEETRQMKGRQPGDAASGASL